VVRADLALAQVRNLAGRSGEARSPGVLSTLEKLTHLADALGPRVAEEPIESLCAEVRARFPRSADVPEELYSKEIDGVCHQLAASTTEHSSGEAAGVDSGRRLTIQSRLSERDLQRILDVDLLKIKKLPELPGGPSLYEAEVKSRVSKQEVQERVSRTDPEVEVFVPMTGSLQ
jgi:hypothetical protein